MKRLDLPSRPRRALLASAAIGALFLAAQAVSIGTAEARDASGKGTPEYGAGHDTGHGVQPGRGISGKPEDHGSGTSHVPGPKGGHDSESHDSEEHESGHESGSDHVPGPKGGHEEGEEHEHTGEEGGTTGQ